MARPRLISDEQILSTMRSRVLSHGPAVSLDVVADELGVSAPALLKRFGNRQALMLAALRPPEHPEWIAWLQRGPSDAPLVTQLLELFTSMTTFMDAVVPCIVALRESGIPAEQVYPKAKTPERGQKALHQWLQLAKDKGLVSADEIETASFAILGAIQTRAFFAHMTQRSFSPRAQREYVEQLAHFFTRALTSLRSAGVRRVVASVAARTRR